MSNASGWNETVAATFWSLYERKRKTSTKISLLVKKAIELRQSHPDVAFRLIERILNDFPSDSPGDPPGNAEACEGALCILGDLAAEDDRIDDAIDYLFQSVCLGEEREQGRRSHFPYPWSAHPNSYKQASERLQLLILENDLRDYYPRLRSHLESEHSSVWYPGVGLMWLAYNEGNVAAAKELCLRLRKRDTRDNPGDPDIPVESWEVQPLPAKQADWIRHQITGEGGHVFLLGLLGNDSQITPASVTTLIDSSFFSERLSLETDDDKVSLKFADYAFTFYWISSTRAIERAQLLAHNFAAFNKKRFSKIPAAPNEITNVMFCRLAGLERHAVSNDEIELWARLEETGETVIAF